MRSMPGPGDAVTWGPITSRQDPRWEPEEEQEDERTDDGAPEFYDINDGWIDE